MVKFKRFTLMGIMVMDLFAHNIEVVNGTCVDEFGNGKIDTTSEYNYISYKYVDCEPGDEIKTVFIYNPLNDEPDDIIFRQDFVK